MASKATKRPLIEHFSALKDPRQIWKVVYPLPEIMLLVLCATLAGAEDFVEVRLWGCEEPGLPAPVFAVQRWPSLPRYPQRRHQRARPRALQDLLCGLGRGVARCRARPCRHRRQHFTADARPPQGPRAAASCLRLGGP